MADPAIRSSARTGGGSTANPHLAKKPAGLTVGDLIVIAAGGGNGLPSGAPSGFDQRAQTTLAGWYTLTIYTKIADAADVAAANFPVPNANAKSLRSQTFAVSNPGPVGFTVAESHASKKTFDLAVSTYTPPPNALWLGWACTGGGISGFRRNATSQSGTEVIAYEYLLSSQRTQTDNPAITSAGIVMASNGSHAIAVLAVDPISGPEWTALSVSINDGAASTDDNDVILALHAEADGAAPTSMRFSDDGVTWSDWEDYATSRGYQLSAQTSYPSETKTVYAKFRLVDGADTFDSDAVSDTIDLEVEWTSAVVIVNADAEETYSKDVQVRFRAFSSAYLNLDFDVNGPLAHLVTKYRIRDAAGSWSEWGTAVPSGFQNDPGWTFVALTLGDFGARTVEVQWEDGEGNQWTASDGIEVLPTGVLIGNAPPPQDITNWRLQIGTKLDLIDQLDAPPQFTRGEHGPGALSAEIPVDDVMRRYANELEAGEKVKLWDGTVLLWDGKLKPVAPVSDDESLLVIEARGALDEAKQHGGMVACFVDGSVESWQPMPKAYKAYAYSFEGGIRIEHEKGRGVESGRLGSVYYWLLRGRREDSESVIDHLYFADSDIDVAGTVDGVPIWWCKFYVAENPWGTWYQVPANHNGEWNGETDSGAQRIPSGTDSFADLAADHWPGVEVRAIRVSMKCSVDRTAAESTANRWAEFEKPQVYSLVDADPRANDVLAYWAEEMGYPTVTEATGAPFKSAVWPEETTIAAMMEEAASIPSGGAEWRWSDDTFYCRPKPTTPEFRHRWYVVDTRRCSYGVVTDEELRKDYVKVLYQIEGDATYPNGTVRTLYRPSAPTLLTARVETLDLTELGPIPATDAQNAGDEWLAYNSAQAKAGPISGFGGYLRTVDGQWVAACHAHEGDWVSPIDLLDRTPMYVTGVDVESPADVTLYVGGAEREFSFTPSRHPLHGQVPTDWIDSYVPQGRRK